MFLSKRQNERFRETFKNDWFNKNDWRQLKCGGNNIVYIRFCIAPIKAYKIALGHLAMSQF